jgi:hypothetical protein
MTKISIVVLQTQSSFGDTAFPAAIRYTIREKRDEGCSSATLNTVRLSNPAPNSGQGGFRQGKENAKTLVLSLQPPSNEFGANSESPLKWTE